MRQAKLVSVFYKLTAKKFLRLWSSKKNQELGWSPHIFKHLVSCFWAALLTGQCCARRPLTKTLEASCTVFTITFLPKRTGFLFVCVCVFFPAGRQVLPVRAYLITPSSWTHTLGWYLLIRPKILRQPSSVEHIMPGQEPGPPSSWWEEPQAGQALLPRAPGRPKDCVCTQELLWYSTGHAVRGDARLPSLPQLRGTCHRAPG